MIVNYPSIFFVFQRSNSVSLSAFVTNENIFLRKKTQLCIAFDEACTECYKKSSSTYLRDFDSHTSFLCPRACKRGI
jgi:hypothetical protein